MQPGVGTVPNMGSSHYPPSFSNYYNPNIGQQNIGSQMTASMMGGIQSAPGVLAGMGTAAGLASFALPKMGVTLGGGLGTALGGLSYLDPLSAGFNLMGRGASAGRFLGTLGGLGGIGTGTFGGAMGGIGAGLGGLAGAAIPAALLYGAYKGVSAFGQGGVHQAEINRMFSDYSFANPNALGGRGFNAMQMGRIGDAMHNINTSSSFISGGDAMKLTEQFQQMGLARGADSVDKLTTKLSEFGKMADEVAQRMGSSITEVSGLIQRMRGNGFFSSSEVAGNVTSMRTMESMGVSNEQFLGAQQQAGSMARGMGLTNTAGANFMSAAGSQMVSALESGMMDQEQMMRLTGTQHYADAGMAFAQKMQGSLGNFMKSGVGRAFLAGIGQVEDGKFTGKIDASALSGLSAGGDFTSIMDRGRRSLQGRNAGRSFITNQDAMLNDLMGSEQGLTSMVGAVRSMAKKANLGDDEDAFVLLGKRMQMGTEMELRELYKFAEQQDQVRKTILRKRAEELATERFQTSMARSGIRGRIADYTGRAADFFSPIPHAGAQFMTQGSAMFEDIDMAFRETISGVKRDAFNVRQGDIDSVNRMLSAGMQVASATSDVTLESVSMAGGSGLGAYSGMNGSSALMLQRAAASKNFSGVESILSASIPDSDRKVLDRNVKNVQADSEITKLLGEARAAKLSGSPSNLSDSISKLKSALVSKGYVNKTTADRDTQYLLAKMGGEDVLAKDLANATLSVKGGETIESEEDKKFRESMMASIDGMDSVKQLGAAKLGAGLGFGLGVGTASLVGAGVTAVSGALSFGFIGTATAAGITAGAASAVGATAAVAAGAEAGAAVGSFIPIPGVGTLVGLAAGAAVGYMAYQYMKPEEQKLMEKIMDEGEGVELMGSLKSPRDQAEFSQLLEEFKKTADSEDEAYEKAAEAFSAKYGKKITPNDVRTADEAMTIKSGKNSAQRAKMTVTDFAKNKGMQELVGYSRFKSQTKARARMNDQMKQTLSKQTIGVVGEASFKKALTMSEESQAEANAKDAEMSKQIQVMLDNSVGMTASEDDPILKQALAAGASVRAAIGSIEGNITEEDLLKQLGGQVSQEDLDFFRKNVTKGTGLVTKDELSELGKMMSENAVRGVLSGGSTGGMTTGGEFAGTDAELQAQALKQTAFMIDALYAKATGKDQASTAGGQRVLQNMATS